jgi:DNA repair protein RecO (recombination protein O)
MAASGYYIASGIILKRRNIGEADRLITIFTKENGKITAIAKGVRRIYSRRSPYVELFRHIRVTLARGKSIDTVNEAEGIGSAGVVGRSLSRFGHYAYVCELIDRLVPEQVEHADVYGLLVLTFERIRTATSWAQLQSCGHEFSLSLLRMLGYLPPEKQLTASEIERYIESIIERKLTSPLLLTRLAPR